uniref:centrosomal protein of 128 kDa isoform X6 n=1 Tax=Podarcis muralis TaxID=64176 RepID=UPI0010A01AC2|nr:centrosomal protein of 128 kDa isoform X6 [Podarcis muralis]
MADSSSESDNFHRRIGRRGPIRATRVRNHGGAEDVTEKIHTLASTLQDTNRNLKHVDQMLGQYREYNNEQADAIANLKETLEQSIGQLRSQRLLRNSGVRSASLSSLYPSDLDGGAPEGRHFQPTSPLRDYSDTLGTRRRRSRSAVRFVDRGDNPDQLHSLHQSLRDLSSEQVRLGDDLNRELSRRNRRTDAETKRMLEDLSDKLNESQRQDAVSEQVERRLQEIEREIRSERQLVERRQDQLGHMSLHLQEALKQQDAKANEVETVLKNKVLKMEGEKNKLEQDLEQSRRKLDQSENSREVLLHQIEDLRSQLLRAEEERLNLHHQISQVAMHHQSHPAEQKDDGRRQRVLERSDPEKQEMEKQIWELRAQLNHSAVMSEIEELKRCIERKDKEKAQLGIQIEAELVEERNLVKAHRRQVEKMKIECDKLVEELNQKEEENSKFRRKYQLMKQELDEKNKRTFGEDDHLRRIEEDRLHLHDQLRSLQNEQESILSMIGSEIDAACEVLARDSVEKFTAISLTPGVQNDPHRWLAETKTKLKWLCEEVKERETKEKKLRRQLLQNREQLKHLTLSKESEHQNLIGQLEKREQLLDEVYQERKDLLEKTLRKEEEIGALQERITALETSTRVALDHLESVPEKLNLLEDFRDFGDSYNQTNNIEDRYSKYKEIMGSLHQHLEDSKRRLEDFRDKKTVADISAIQSTSSNWRTNTSFMSSSMLSNSGSLTKSTFPSDSNATKKGAINMTVNGTKLRTQEERY